MLDRLLRLLHLAAPDTSVVENCQPLWQLPYDYVAPASLETGLGQPGDTYASLQESQTGPLLQPGQVIDGKLQVLSVETSVLGPAYIVKHLVWERELRVIVPLNSVSTDKQQHAIRSQVTSRLAEVGVHPNLVTVLGICSVGQKTGVLTDKPQGGTLRQRMAESAGASGDLARFLDQALQLCCGLAYAHSKQVYHNCLCPDVCYIDNAGTLCLDQFFGLRTWNIIASVPASLAKDKSFPEGLAGQLPGPVDGSCLYLSPERWAKGGSCSVSDNLYSLGCILYELATGHPPWRPYVRHGEAQLASLKARVLSEELVSPKTCRPDLPEAIDRLIVGLLQVDPGARPDLTAAMEILAEEFKLTTQRNWPRPRLAAEAFKADNLNNAALMVADQGGYAEAIRLLRLAQQVSDVPPQVVANLAVLEWLSGQIDINSALERVRQVTSHCPEARNSLLWLLVHSGNHKQAQELVDELEQEHHCGFQQNMLGLLLLDEGSLRQARTAFERAVAGEPGRWVVHHNLGVCLDRLGEKEPALECLQRAVDTYPASAARVSLARYLAAFGRVPEAFEQLSLALESDSESAWVHYHLGAYYASMGLAVPGFDAAPTDLAQAEKHFEAAVQRSCGFFRAWEGLQQCRRRLGKPSTAEIRFGGAVNCPELRELGSLYSVSLVRALSGHKEAVNALTMSWDGRYIVSAGHDDSILLWDSLTSTVRARLRGHAGAVRSVSITADASMLASGSDDGTARLWHVPGGAILRELSAHAGPVTSVAITPSGSVLLTGGDDRTVRVWDAYTGDLRLTLQGHSSRVNAVAVSYDGSIGVSGGAEHRVNVWNLHTGELLLSLFADLDDFEERAARDCTGGAHGLDGVPFGDVGEEVYALSLSSNAKYLLTGGSSQHVRLWNIEDGNLVTELVGHENEVRAVSLSPDGRMALSGGWDCTLRLWNVVSGECIKVIDAHEHQVTTVHTCADGRFGLSGSLDRIVKMWEWKEEALPACPGPPPLLYASAAIVYREAAADLFAQSALKEAHEHFEAERYREAFALLRKVQRLPGKSRDPEVCGLLGDCVEHGTRVGVRGAWCNRVIIDHSSWVLRVAWSEDSSLLASGGLDGCIGLHSVADGSRLGSLVGHGREIISLDFANDNTQLISSSSDCTIRAWNLESGLAETVLRGHDSEITCGIISRHLPMVLSSSHNGRVFVWNLQSQKVLCELSGHEGVVYSVALALSDRLAATAGADKRLVFWELPSGRQIAELKGHVKPITSLSFASDCEHIVSGGEDGRVIVWELVEHKAIMHLVGMQAAVRSVHWLANSDFVAGCGDDGIICVWKVKLNELSGSAENTVEPAAASSGDDQEHKVSGNQEPSAEHLEQLKLSAQLPDSGPEAASMVQSAAAESPTAVAGAQPSVGAEIAKIEPLGRLSGHEGPVRWVRFSPNGRFLASCGNDLSIRIWHIDWDVDFS